MSITEDTGNQPAATHPTGTTTTTASFTPPSGALLVALVAANGLSTAATTASLSDSLGGTWTLLKRVNAFSSINTIGGTAEVWCRDSPGVSMTVTASGWASNDGNLTVRTLLGAKPAAQQTGATGASTTGASVPPTAILTPTQLGSRIYGAALDYTTNITLTANAQTTSIDQFVDAGAGDTWATFKASADTSSLTSTTYGYTDGNASYNVAAVEILAAATGASQPGIAFHPGRGPSRWSRFFQPPRDTTLFSASLTDTGSAADALTVADVTVGAQSPGGWHPGKGPTSARFFQPPRDYTVAATTQVGLSDTGSADDSQLAVSATIPLTDAGSGSDTLAVSATLPLSDAGSASDALSVSATVPLADTGTAADTVSVADVTVGAATPSPLHPGRGPTQARFFQPPRSTDIITATPVSLSDTGSASDALTVSATVPLADSASAADALAVTATLALADAASAADALAVSALLSLADTGSAADAVSVVTGGVPSLPGVLTNSTRGASVGPASNAARATTTSAGSAVSTSSSSARLKPSTSGGQA